MEPNFFGTEQVTEEDRAYRGSRFSEVRAALFANPYQKVWEAAGEPPMPVYGVSLAGALRGVLPSGSPYFFRQAVARAVDSSADLRWGADRKGFRRIIHPNGICLTGLWEIFEQTPYSGYFRRDSQALVVGRYSTCCRETRRGHKRSLSLVGKLFPTNDPNHGNTLGTANFITERIRFDADSEGIGDSVGAGGVGPDQVALHSIADRVAAGNPDARGMARDEVARACRRPANQVVGAIRNLYAKEMIARSAVAGAIGADKAILDQIVAGI